LFDILLSATCMVIGYLLGTIPTGYLIAKARGVDIQKVGSGNIGATNVLRSIGTFAGIMVAVVDPLKGALAIVLPRLIDVPPWGVALTGLATVLGNNFNVFLRLRGGKGIATSFGVFLALDPVVGIFSAVIGVYAIILSRYVSLGSLIAATAAPLLLITKGDYPMPYLYLAVALALLASFRHRENIHRLAVGTERRFGEKAKTEMEEA
jgi:glycerol-3-phosphate acyltransferase PlsY